MNRITFIFLGAAAALGLASCDNAQQERENQLGEKLSIA